MKLTEEIQYFKRFWESANRKFSDTQLKELQIKIRELNNEYKGLHADNVKDSDFELKLLEISDLLGFFGVEYIGEKNLWYINSGDTYNPTIVFDPSSKLRKAKIRAWGSYFD